MIRAGESTGSLKKKYYLKIIQEKSGMDGRAVRKLKKYKIDELKDLIYLIETAQEKAVDEYRRR